MLKMLHAICSMEEKRNASKLLKKVSAEETKTKKVKTKTHPKFLPSISCIGIRNSAQRSLLLRVLIQRSCRRKHFCFCGNSGRVSVGGQKGSDHNSGKRETSSRLGCHVSSRDFGGGVGALWCDWDWLSKLVGRVGSDLQKRKSRV